MHNSDQNLKRKQKLAKTVVAPLLVVGAILIAMVLITVLLVRSYDFEITPREALPVSLKLQQGVGLFYANRLYTLSLENVVRIEAPRYVPEQLIIDGDSAQTLKVILKPMPAELNLSTETQIENLAWYINDKLVHVGESLIQHASPGETQIKIVSPYYEPFVYESLLTPGQEWAEKFALTPVKGSLSISSNPPGALVSVSGKEVGVTPITLELDGGVHSVNLALEGYEPLQDDIEITFGNEQVERRFPLTLLQAHLNVQLEPKNGILSLDQKPIRLSTSVNANQTYALSYEKTGYLSYKENIRLEPGEIKNIDVRLTPQYRDVQFDSEPKANVYIDNKLAGSTPLKVSMQTVKKNVRFEAKYYRAQSFEYMPSTKKANTLAVKLISEFDARRAEGKPTVAKQMGIDLNLIEAENFVMGSAPNTPFRQNHEYPVQVKFTRDFWMSSKEITRSQYAKFSGGAEASELPVSNVSWEQAAAFCNWLSEQEGLRPVYNLKAGTLDYYSRGYRLPTEAEWEYVASTHLQYKKLAYFWGDSERLKMAQGNYADESMVGKQTFVLSEYKDDYPELAPVGVHSPRSGFYDMDGNVSEWVQDRFSVLPPVLTRIHENYLGLENGSGHVIKGGSYKTGRLRELRNAYRRQGTSPSDDLGFRVARYEDKQ